MEKRNEVLRARVTKNEKKVATKKAKKLKRSISTHIRKSFGL